MNHFSLFYTDIEIKFYDKLHILNHNGIRFHLVVIRSFKFIPSLISNSVNSFEDKTSLCTFSTSKNLVWLQSAQRKKMVLVEPHEIIMKFVPSEIH